MHRVVTGSSLSDAENTLEATVVAPHTTVDQLLTGTPTQAGSGHNQLWIGDLSFVQERCRTAAPLALGVVPGESPSRRHPPHPMWCGGWRVSCTLPQRGNPPPVRAATRTSSPPTPADCRTGVLLWVSRCLAGCAARFRR
jgi:hypothetical protein